jgi:hypothetical protein
MEDSGKQPYLPALETPNKPSLSEKYQKEKDEKEKRFNLEINNLKRGTPEEQEIEKRYRKFYWQTQKQKAKEAGKIVPISLEQKRNILECAKTGEKPIWLDPERQKREQTESQVENWRRYTDIQ